MFSKLFNIFSFAEFLNSSKFFSNNSCLFLSAPRKDNISVDNFKASIFPFSIVKLYFDLSKAKKL